MLIDVNIQISKLLILSNHHKVQMSGRNYGKYGPAKEHTLKTEKQKS